MIFFKYYHIHHIRIYFKFMLSESYWDIETQFLYCSLVFCSSKLLCSHSPYLSIIVMHITCMYVIKTACIHTIIRCLKKLRIKKYIEYMFIFTEFVKLTFWVFFTGCFTIYSFIHLFLWI